MIAGLGRGAANKLLEARRTRGNDLRKFLDNSLDAITVANGKITKFRSQASIALNKVTVHLQGAHKRDDLRKLLANSLDAITLANGKITKFRSQASIALNTATAHLQGTQKTIAGLGGVQLTNYWKRVAQEGTICESFLPTLSMRSLSQMEKSPNSDRKPLSR